LSLEEKSEHIQKFLNEDKVVLRRLYFKRERMLQEEHLWQNREERRKQTLSYDKPS
jgi:hypothetical protein